MPPTDEMRIYPSCKTESLYREIDGEERQALEDA
jgi:hypothetical protein